MNRLTCIVFERTGSWAAALRVQIARESPPATSRLRIVELRHLPDLRRQLSQHSAGIALIEIRQSTAADVLSWLPDMISRHPKTRFISLLNRHDTSRPHENGPSLFPAEFVEVLRECGVVDTIESLRHLGRVIEMARLSSTSPAHFDSGPQSLEQWACNCLPWQDS